MKQYFKTYRDDRNMSNTFGSNQHSTFKINSRILSPCRTLSYFDYEYDLNLSELSKDKEENVNINSCDNTTLQKSFECVMENMLKLDQENNFRSSKRREKLNAYNENFRQIFNRHLNTLCANSGVEEISLFLKSYFPEYLIYKINLINPISTNKDLKVLTKITDNWKCFMKEKFPSLTANLIEDKILNCKSRTPEFVKLEESYNHLLRYFDNPNDENSLLQDQIPIENLLSKKRKQVTSTSS